MSIIFGIRKGRGAAVTRQEMLGVAAATERYAPDGTSVAVIGRIGMGYQPYRTHERSNLESQPVVDAQGNILTLDGRIDNHAELRGLLEIRDKDMPDSLIVLTAFLRWGENCFSRLVGDWALALWSPTEQVVYLARDHAGTRSLYFRNVAGVLQWSTYLEAFFADGSTHSLDEQYAARYLSSQPIRDLTPYKGIRSVPPSHYLAVWDDRVRSNSHWEWMASRRTQYQSDRDYQEHFLSLFNQSVERRTGPGAAILAQLSGGMDSTSIVCMSDHIRRSQDPKANLIDTISYYDDSEPNWNERPYFSIVEARRGKVGIHIARSFMDRTFEPSDPSQGVYLLPGPDSSVIEWEKRLHTHLSGHGYRAILSGIGGDEVLGGVPTPLPELANYLMSGHFNSLLRNAFAWCLIDRTPFILMLFDTVRFTAALHRESQLDEIEMPPWITPHLRKCCMGLARTSGIRNRHFRVAPSVISNGLTWWSIMETLPHLNPSFLSRHEYRYPYLDRDLVDFLFSIPREQLVRPGRRRSLMRRALASIVPVEILERRRKAFIIRGPIAALQRSRSKIDELFAKASAIRFGMIDPSKLQMAINLTVVGTDPKWWPELIRMINFELWLRTSSNSLAPMLSDISNEQVPALQTRSRPDPCGPRHFMA